LKKSLPTIKKKPEEGEEGIEVSSSSENVSDLEESSSGESGDEDSVQNCDFCNDGGDLVLCDHCPRGFHKECCVPPLTRVPRGNWKCGVCAKTDGVPNKKRVNYREMVGSSSSSEEDSEASDASSGSEEIEEAEECYICQEVGELVLCDNCPKGYHKECLDPPMKYVPRGKWICDHCDSVEESHEEFCRGCQHGPPGVLLLCETCPAIWHLKCLDPPLLRTPKGDWFCDDCKNKESTVEEEKEEEKGDEANEEEKEEVKEKAAVQEEEKEEEVVEKKGKGKTLRSNEIAKAIEEEKKESEEEMNGDAGVTIQEKEKENNDMEVDVLQSDLQDGDELKLDIEIEDVEEKKEKKVYAFQKGKKGKGKAALAPKKKGGKKATQESEELIKSEGEEDKEENKIEIDLNNDDKNEEEEKQDVDENEVKTQLEIDEDRLALEERQALLNKEFEDYQNLLAQRKQQEEEEQQRRSLFIGHFDESRVLEKRFQYSWGFYEGTESIQKLVDWLDTRGNREKALKKQLTSVQQQLEDLYLKRLSNIERSTSNDPMWGSTRGSRGNGKAAVGSDVDAKKAVFLFYNGNAK
jgi:uncharacterized Zn finger protein (UPF0148 family)